MTTRSAGKRGSTVTSNSPSKIAKTTTTAPTRATKVPKAAAIPKDLLSLKQAYTIPGHVFVVGSGDCGQLGLGTDVFDKEKPAKLAYFDELEIVQVFAGGLHTLALSKSGKLYSWGCNDQMCLGRSGEETEPGLVEGLENVFIVSAACGDSCSVALTREGRLYGWGTFRGTNGIFGFSPHKEIQETPYLIPDIKGIVEISSGANHLLAMAKDGKIYAWGVGEQGQLGRKVMTRNAVDASLLPRSINFHAYKKSPKFTGVRCGGYHSFVIHETNSVYSCGLNNYGQLGQGNLDEHTLPDEVAGLPSDHAIKDIGGGEHFSIILTANGEVWVCGRNDSGQLGIQSEKFKEHCDSAVRLEGLPKIREISCGAAFTLAISEDTNNLYAWGYGEMGQLANGNQDAPVPFKVELKERTVLNASGGGQHSVFLLTPKVDG